MNVRRSPWGALLFTFLLTACGSAQAPLEEITLPPARINLRGFSFVPLAEAGWSIEHRNSTELSITKYGGDRDETYVIWSTLFPMEGSDSPQDYVRRNLGLDPPRHKVIRHDVVTSSLGRATCARSSAVAEDHQAERGSGRSDVMILEMETAACPHPRDSTLGILVSFSHRHYPGHGDPQLGRKVEAIMNSIEFTDL